ncbi:MAG: hypothetical protein H8E05_00695 [Bacteroidetes bacterium]|nr:hypothetical protein [Bacteroidota bacterium]
MKTRERTKEEVINDIVHYVSTEGMTEEEAGCFREDVSTAISEYFNEEEE